MSPIEGKTRAEGPKSKSRVRLARAEGPNFNPSKRLSKDRPRPKAEESKRQSKAFITSKTRSNSQRQSIDFPRPKAEEARAEGPSFHYI